jgi:GTP cyclohydrolase I
MNIQVTTRPDLPTREDAAEALRLLREWADTAPAEDVAALDPSISRLLDGGAYPVFNRTYPEGFRADAAYKDTLPDLQNGPASLIRGANRQIQHVGISNFRLPIRYHTREALRTGAT